MLFQLHVGNSVHEQSAHTVAALVNSDRMSSAVQLIGCCQTGRSASDDCYFLPATDLRWSCMGIAHLICIFNNSQLITFGSYRITIQITGTGSLAESRTHTAGELREVAGTGQTVICFLPVAQIYQIIPFRHQVLQRTAGHHTAQHLSCLAERNTTCHTSGALFLLFLVGQRCMKFIKMFDSL